MKAAGDAGYESRSPPELARDRLRVLVVERDLDQLERITSWLDARRGVTVQGFATPEEALTESGGERYDLCLLDYGLEGVDGVMLGAMIRTLNPGAKMILMTDSIDLRIRRGAAEHGFHAVIAKPKCRTALEGLLAS